MVSAISQEMYFVPSFHEVKSYPSFSRITMFEENLATFSHHIHLFLPKLKQRLPQIHTSGFQTGNAIHNPEPHCPHRKLKICILSSTSSHGISDGTLL